MILSKLMNDWKLMHELAVLRAIYLLGSGAYYVLQRLCHQGRIWNLNKTVKFSGDLLQHFLTVIFNKLGKGELTNDDFELNIILQVTKFD